MIRNLPAVWEMQEMRVRSLGQVDPLEEEMATHSNIPAWKIPWTRGAWWATVHEVAESDMTECPYTYNTHRGIAVTCKIRSPLVTGGQG